MHFSDLAIKYGPWSLSKAQTALTCPFRFDMKYTRKVKGVSPPKDSIRKVGVAAHAALEMLLKGKDIKDSLVKAAVDENLTSVETEDLRSLGHNIKSFMERLSIFKKKKNVNAQHVEKKFGLTQDMQPTEFFGKDVFFRGVCDLCLIAGDPPNKYLVVIDHKSGRSKDLSYYTDQLKLYSLAGIHLFSDIAGVQSAVHFIPDENIVWSTLNSSKVIRELYIPWYVDFLNKAAEGVPAKSAQKCWLCPFCEYRGECPLN